MTPKELTRALTDKRLEYGAKRGKNEWERLLRGEMDIVEMAQWSRDRSVHLYKHAARFHQSGSVEDLSAILANAEMILFTIYVAHKMEEDLGYNVQALRGESDGEEWTAT